MSYPSGISLCNNNICSQVTTPSSDPGSPGSLYHEVMSESGYQLPNSSNLPTFEEALADTSFYADQLTQSQQLQHPYQGSMSSEQM